MLLGQTVLHATAQTHERSECASTLGTVAARPDNFFERRSLWTHPVQMPLDKADIETPGRQKAIPFVQVNAFWVVAQEFNFDKREDRFL